MNNNSVLIGGACLFKEEDGKCFWLLVKSNPESEWELPKIVVRKVESSVRAVLRMLGEQGGMSVRILEEAGRSGGVTTVNNKVVPQRIIYYLTRQKSSEGEIIGFSEYSWLDYAKAVKKLSSKKEVQMLTGARDEYKNWLKKRKKRRALLKLQASKAV